MRLLRANLGGIPEVGNERVSGRKSNTARVNRAAYSKKMWVRTRLKAWVVADGESSGSMARPFVQFPPQCASSACHSLYHYGPPHRLTATQRRPLVRSKPLVRVASIQPVLQQLFLQRCAVEAQGACSRSTFVVKTRHGVV